MMMVQKPEISSLDFKVEANKAAFCDLLEGLKHPYILPTLEVRLLCCPGVLLELSSGRLHSREGLSRDFPSSVEMGLHS